jgi:uncharacterized protein YkwD
MSQSPRRAVWRRASIAVGICGALHLAVPATSSAAASCAAAGSLPAEAGVVSTAAATLCLLNRERRAHHLRPLRNDRRLNRAARGHAADMVTNDYFSHWSPDGQGFADRILVTGYGESRPAQILGENLAWGSGELSTPAAIVKAWMGSRGHRANILRPGFRDVGIGVVDGTPSHDASLGATYGTSFGTLTGE